MADGDQLTRWLTMTAAGDQRAFQALYDATAPQLFALLLRIVSNRDDAQDALQDVYVMVWQKAGSYAPARGAPLTWLLSIARYRGLDTLRRKRARGVTSELSSLAQMLLEDKDVPGPAAVSETQQSLDAVNNCLKTLSSEQRNCVLLAYYEGLTQPELALHLDAPIGTVKSWLRRGLSRLRECLLGMT